MDSNESLFADFMTAPSALSDIAEDAVAFYWDERHGEDNTLLHQAFLLNEFCVMMKEVFDQLADNEIEIPDDLDLDLIEDAIPLVNEVYDNHEQGAFVRRCVQALRQVQGQKIETESLLNILPLVNDKEFIDWDDDPQEP